VLSVCDRINNEYFRAVKKLAPMITWVSLHRWAGLTAWLLRLTITPVPQTGRSKMTDRPRRHLLLLPKFGFTEDMAACFGADANYRLLRLNRTLVKAVFNAFLPAHIDDNNYRIEDARLQAQMLKLRRYWRLVLKTLLKLLPVDAVFTGNFSYAAEQELAAAFSALGVPFIALHKECLKTPGLEPFYEEVYRTRKNRFQGAKVWVYNEIEKRIQIAAGVVDAADIDVTGMPRLDWLHQARLQQGRQTHGQSARPMVLFFLFNTKAGLPIIGRKLPQRFEVLANDLERLNVTQLAAAAHRAMLTLAQTQPQLRVVIKTKGDVQSDKTLEQFFGRRPEFPENFEIVAGGNPVELIKASSVVCGFNSTALIEAVALNKPVVIPRFFEAQDPALAPYLLDMSQAAHFAASEQELIGMLKRFALTSPTDDQALTLGEARKAFLKHWLGNPDGQAGRRVRHALKALMDA
jgi:hypothetical protein